MFYRFSKISLKTEVEKEINLNHPDNILIKQPSPVKMFRKFVFFFVKVGIFSFNIESEQQIFEHVIFF